MSRIFLSPPHMSDQERNLLLDAFDSNWIAPLGPHVDGFEAELAAFVGVKGAAALSSGTAGLHLALLQHDVGQGDVVLCSSFTFAATINAIRYVGAEPVFIDSCLDDWCMDVELLKTALSTERAAGRSVKAVLAVDLYGLMPDLAAIEHLCKQENVVLIEDAAEALGSSRAGRAAGTFGEAAIFSFNGNKIMTTSGGGMLVSNDPDVIQRTRYLATQARQPVPWYQHEDVGYNYRLSNLLAAVGRGQLARLPSMIQARAHTRVVYAEAFADLPFTMMPQPAHTEQNHWLTCITIDETTDVTPDAIREHLMTHDIESRNLWKPMHQQPVFAKHRFYGNGVSDALFNTGLCLPSGSSLTDEQRARVIEAIRTTPGL